MRSLKFVFFGNSNGNSVITVITTLDSPQTEERCKPVFSEVLDHVQAEFLVVAEIVSNRPESPHKSNHLCYELLSEIVLCVNIDAYLQKGIKDRIQKQKKNNNHSRMWSVPLDYYAWLQRGNSSSAASDQGCAGTVQKPLNELHPSQATIHKVN